MESRAFETDTINGSEGGLQITFLGHGSVLFTHREKRIYVDPFSRVADYAALPKADLVVITHDHRDHLDPEALDQIRVPSTVILHTELCQGKVAGGSVMRNGDAVEVLGLRVEAIPAYNLVHRRDTGELFHPVGHGNGYVIGFGDVRVLVAGDTENTPELKSLRNIDVAFLPMNLPYTMTPEMVADVALAVRPRVLYPYHFGSTDPSRLVEHLEPYPWIEVRVRALA